MYEVAAKEMTKDEALLYVSKLRQNQKVKIIVLSNESARSDKQLLNENAAKWDYGCYKD
tara:strand:- start:494 stop:670 length:177 start_codon:yes stop_codon:yes gene_type:complete